MSTQLTNTILASNSFETALDERQPRNPKILSLAGNPSGVVQIPDRPEFIYVRISGDNNRCTAARCTNNIPAAGQSVYIQKLKAGVASPYEVVGIAGSAYASTILLDQGIGPGSDVQAAIDYLNLQLENIQTYLGGWGKDGWGQNVWGGK